MSDMIPVITNEEAAARAWVERVWIGGAAHVPVGFRAHWAVSNVPLGLDADTYPGFVRKLRRAHRGFTVTRCEVTPDGVEVELRAARRGLRAGMLPRLVGGGRLLLRLEVTDGVVCREWGVYEV